MIFSKLIKPRVDRDRTETGLQPIDLVLSGISSGVAVHAAGASLASDKNSQFFTFIVLIGTLTSALVVWFLGKSKVLLADATIYTCIAAVSLLGISALNDATPDAIYIGPLMMAGVLSWMLSLGTFVVWRDQTMLFQAVPAVALFGLVGCYDTFRASVAYFFVFLLCQATLLARAHGRVMLRQARSSGVDALEMAAMRKGPWRWMAGPEWALASALTIVLISVIGAPILRESASGFSGLVRYTPPISPLTQMSLATFTPTGGGTRVGTGPNTLHETPVLRVDMPEPMYLRGFAFGPYRQGSWHPRVANPLAADPGTSTPRALALSEMKDRRQVQFRIEPLLVFSTLVPVPGEVEDVSADTSNVYWRNIGGSYSIRGDAPFPPLEGTAVVFGGRAEIRDANLEMAQLIPEYVQRDGIPPDVFAFAKQVTRNAKTDFDKALAIKSAIENEAKYNLHAPPTPKGIDPVSYFLFQTKEGYCDLFATSMTLMARSVGLPARYVTGYYPFGSDRDAAGRFIVRENDAHAWCEIFFKDAGWVIFDATEGATQVDGGGRGSANDRAFWQTGWFTTLLLLTVGGGIGYGIFLARGKFKRDSGGASPEERQMRRALIKQKAQVRKEYQAFERELRRSVKRPRGIGETIAEYTAAAKTALGHRAPLASETESAFANALYANPHLEPSLVNNLKARVKTFRRSRRSKGT